MRLESNADGTQKVWLSQQDYTDLKNAAEGAALLAVRLGAEVGLRVSEIAAVRPCDSRQSTVDLSAVPTLTADHSDTQGRQIVYLLEVYGKDTSGDTEDGKRRDALLPEDVYRELELHTAKQSVGERESVVGVSARTIRRYISELGDELAETTSEPGWQYLSTHDLRRYFATTLLQVHGMNPEVVKAVGGWNSYADMKPYLQDPVEEVIAAEFAAAGLL